MRTLLVIAILLSAEARAQTLNYAPFTVPNGVPISGTLFNGGAVNPAMDYVTLTRLPDRNDARTSTGFGYVSVADLSTALSAQQGSPSSVALISIANYLDRVSARFREGIALAGAINILPPNPGDRFAISFGGAGYDGAGAGSVAVSMRIDESTLAYVGYARGPTQNLVKGGVGFSFR